MSVTLAPGTRERLVLFYQRYAPEKNTEENVEKILSMFVGKEEDLFVNLVHKYGPEPSISDVAIVNAPSAPAVSVPPGLPERLIRFYKKYAPDRVDSVDDLLPMFVGNEEEMFKSLVEKYGPEPHFEAPPPLAPGTRERLIRFYEKYSTEKIANVDEVLPMFAGNEEQMFRRLVEKYGPEPEYGSVQSPPPSTTNEAVPMSTAHNSSGTKDETRERLVRFYKKHAPDKLTNVDSILASYDGRTDALFQKLVQMYGPEPPRAPTSPAEASDAQAINTNYRERLIAFYTKYNPEKLNNVDKTLAGFKGKEEQIFPPLVKKYGPEPTPGDMATKPPTVMQPIPSSGIPTQPAPTANPVTQPAPSAESVAQSAPSPETVMQPAPTVTQPAPSAESVAQPTPSTTGTATQFSPTTAPSDVPPASEAKYRERLVAFYTKYNPEKLNTVDTTLASYAGEEEALFKILVGKYGPEPTAADGKPETVPQPEAKVDVITQPVPSAESVTQPASSPESVAQPAPSPETVTQPAPSAEVVTQPAAGSACGTQHAAPGTHEANSQAKATAKRKIIQGILASKRSGKLSQIADSMESAVESTADSTVTQNQTSPVQVEGSCNIDNIAPHPEAKVDVPTADTDKQPAPSAGAVTQPAADSACGTQHAAPGTHEANSQAKATAKRKIIQGILASKRSGKLSQIADSMESAVESTADSIVTQNQTSPVQVEDSCNREQQAASSVEKRSELWQESLLAAVVADELTSRSIVGQKEEESWRNLITQEGKFFNSMAQNLMDDDRWRIQAEEDNTLSEIYFQWNGMLTGLMRNAEEKEGSIRQWIGQSESAARRDHKEVFQQQCVFVQEQHQRYQLILEQGREFQKAQFSLGDRLSRVRIEQMAEEQSMVAKTPKYSVSKREEPNQDYVDESEWDRFAEMVRKKRRHPIPLPTSRSEEAASLYEKLEQGSTEVDNLIGDIMEFRSKKGCAACSLVAHDEEIVPRRSAPTPSPKRFHRKALPQAEVKAAINIQRVFRGWLCRRFLLMMFQHEVQQSVELAAEVKFPQHRRAKEGLDRQIALCERRVQKERLREWSHTIVMEKKDKQKDRAERAAAFQETPEKEAIQKEAQFFHALRKQNDTVRKLLKKEQVAAVREADKKAHVAEASWHDRHLVKSVSRWRREGLRTFL